MPALARATELRQQRVKQHERYKEILDRVQSEGRALTAEERVELDKLDESMDQLKDEYERIERAVDRDAEIIADRERAAEAAGDGTSPDQVGDKQKQYRAAFQRWLAHTPAAPMMQTGDLELLQEGRAGAQIVGTGNLGGYTVPDEGMKTVVEAMLFIGGVRRSRATVLSTATGADLPIPTDNDTSQVGQRLSEQTEETNVVDIAVGQVVLKAFKYSSKIVKASIEFMQDTSLNPDQWIMQRMGKRIGRVLNDDFTYGPGSTTGPEGIQWYSTLGLTAASASTIAWTELVDLEHSVDVSYRTGAEFMMHDSTVKILKKIVDGSNRLIWLPGLAVREPDTILGYPYVVNNDQDEVGAAKHSLLFGDFSTYHIRDVKQFAVVRLVERYVEFGLIGYIGFARHDGRLVDAGTNPIKHLRHPAS